MWCGFGPLDIQQILDRYACVFVEPVGFPPSWPEDHHILLLLGSVPPNIRPYCYPFHHKIEIEMLVCDLLKQGVIRPSTSSFSSLVLLVWKKHGSWHLCIKWKSFLRKVHMVSSLSSISFRCNLQQSQLLPWISNKFWIDMHVCLLSQWDCHLPDLRTIVFRSFLELSLPTPGPIATHFTTRHKLRCLFVTY